MEFLTTSQVARRAKVSVSTVTRWVARGALKPAQKLPGETGPMLFAPETVRDFLEARETTP
jgi:excisionase family DNA binding protein